MPEISKKFKIITIVGAAMFLVLLCFKRILVEKAIQKEQAQTTAIVTKVTSGYRGGITMDYRFFHNNKIFFGSRKVFISSYYLEKFKGKSFTVVYNKLEPSENKLLLLTEDFKEFDLVYPDSVKWVEILKEKSL